MFTPSFQVAYLTAMLAAFSAVAWFTRAGARRIVGAASSVMAFTGLSAPIDNLARRMGFWSYPSCVDPAHPPLMVYLGQALAFVGCVALIGWRTQRRFGGRGVAALGFLVCGGGVARDFTVAELMPRAICMGPAPASLLADVTAWLVVFSVALGVSRLVAGPADKDVLRQSKADRLER